MVEQTRCCDRSPLVTGSRFSSLKKIVARDATDSTDVSRATQRSQYLCVRDNVSLFVRQSQDWRHGYSAGAGRSTCVQTALPGAYETIRHGRDPFICPHRGSRHSPRLPLISKTRGFVAPVVRLACEFSKVVNALLNSRLGTHFDSGCRYAWRPSAGTVSRCTSKVIGEHVRADTARGQGGRLAFRPPCLEHMKRFGTAGMLHAPHRGSRHWSALPLVSKTWSFAQQVRHGARTATGTAPVAVRGGGRARVDWLCGR